MNQSSVLRAVLPSKPKAVPDKKRTAMADEEMVCDQPGLPGNWGLAVPRVSMAEAVKKCKTLGMSSSGRAYKLKLYGPTRADLVPTLRMRILVICLVILGAGLLVWGTSLLVNPPKGEGFKGNPIVGGAFVVLGGCLLLFFAWAINPPRITFGASGRGARRAGRGGL